MLHELWVSSAIMFASAMILLCALFAKLLKAETEHAKRMERRRISRMLSAEADAAWAFAQLCTGRKREFEEQLANELEELSADVAEGGQ